MIFDIVTLAALLVSAVIAFLRGFIRETLTILGVAGGLAAAWYGGPLAAPVVRGWFGAENTDEPQKLMGLVPYDMAADALAYGSIFIIVVIVLSVASHFLAGWARIVGLGAVDRTLGVIFGLARGIVILGLLFLPVQVIFDQKTLDEWLEGSKTRFYVEATSDWMMAMLPESMRKDMEKKAEQAAESMAETTREKLQELDVLDSEDKPQDQDAPERAGPLQEEPGDGYGQGQRQDMNQLFQDNSGHDNTNE